MAGDQDLVSLLKAAGMTPSLVEKINKHGIDKELFTLMDVSFMRNVLGATGKEILEIKTFQFQKVVVLSSDLSSEDGLAPEVPPSATSAIPNETTDSSQEDEKNSTDHSPSITSSNSQQLNESPSLSASSGLSQSSQGLTLCPKKNKLRKVSSNSQSQSTKETEVSSQHSGSVANCFRKNKSHQVSSKSHSQSNKETGGSSQLSGSVASTAGSSSHSDSVASCSKQSQNHAGPSTPQSKRKEKSSSHSDGGANIAGSSSNKRTSTAGDNIFSDNDSDSDKENGSGSEPVTEKDVERAVREFKPDAEPSFSSLKESLPKFDVVSILQEEMKKAHSRFKANFVELLQKKHLDRTKRLCIIRKLTGHLYKSHVTSASAVTSAMKEGMAKSFCVVFPKFANTDDKERPWSPVFSPLGPSGYIANASRSFMRENPQRPTRAKKRKTTEKECEWDDDDIRLLGLINPGKSEKSEILDGMAKCFEVRNAERLRRESITFFMLKYPQFNKYEGEVLSEEFKRLRPEAADMCKTFYKLLPKILALPFRREVNLPIKDDAIKALVLLSQHLPHDIPRRKEKTLQSWGELKDVVVVRKVSDSIDDYIEDRIEKASGPIQPYLIFVRGQVDRDRIVRSFLVLDSQKIQLQVVNSVKCIDWLFQSYFVFGVDYPFGWRNTFHFLQTCFYKIFEHVGARKDKVNSSEFELMQQLTSQSSGT